MRDEVTKAPRTRLDTAARRAALEVELVRWVRRAVPPGWPARRVRVLLARIGWTRRECSSLKQAACDLGVMQELVRQWRARLEKELVEPSPRQRVRDALGVVASALPIPEGAVAELLRARGVSCGRIGVRGLLKVARLVGLDSPFCVSRLGWVVSVRTRYLSPREFAWTIRRALASAGVATAEDVVARFPPTDRKDMRPIVQATLAAAPWARHVDGTPYWCAWERDRPSAPFIRTVHATVAACGALPLAEVLAGLRRANRYGRRARSIPDRETLRLVLAMDPGIRVGDDLVSPGPSLGAEEALTPGQGLLLELVRETQRATGEELVPLEVVAAAAHEAGMPTPTAYGNLRLAPFLYDVRRGVLGLRSAARRSPDAAARRGSRRRASTASVSRPF